MKNCYFHPDKNSISECMTTFQDKELILYLCEKCAKTVNPKNAISLYTDYKIKKYLRDIYTNPFADCDPFPAGVLVFQGGRVQYNKSSREAINVANKTFDALWLPTDNAQ